MATVPDIQGDVIPDLVELERGHRARGWLDEWAKRWRVEDAEELLMRLRDKAHDLHELARPSDHGKATALLKELESLAESVREYVAGGDL
jgi:hypothetical protein